MLDQVDMPFLEDLQKNWAEWPSVRVSAAVAIGHKPPEPPKRIDEQSVAELLAMFPGGQLR